MNRRTYLAPGAQVVGDVTLGENVGIWYNAVVRGDTGSIFIGDNSNVQDNSTLHTDEGHSIHIGKRCVHRTQCGSARLYGWR